MNGQPPNGNWDYFNPPLNDADAALMQSWLKELGKSTWLQIQCRPSQTGRGTAAAIEEIGRVHHRSQRPGDRLPGPRRRSFQHPVCLAGLVEAVGQKDVPVDLSLGLIVKCFEA